MKFWLAQLLSGTDGSPSTMRVGVLMVLFAILFNWVFLTVSSGTAQQLDWQQVAMILGALGFKAVQTKFEQQPPPPPAQAPAASAAVVMATTKP